MILTPTYNPEIVEEIRYRFFCNESVSSKWGIKLYPVISKDGGWYDSPVDGFILKAFWISHLIGNPIKKEMKEILNVDVFNYWEIEKENIHCVPSVLIWNKDTLKACCIHVFTKTDFDEVDTFLNLYNVIQLHDRSMGHLVYTDSMMNDIDKIIVEPLMMTLEEDDESIVVSIGDKHIELVP